MNIAQGPKRGRRNKVDMNCEIKFNHFIDYAESIDDPFWKNIFELMARGGLPPNFYMENNGLTLSYRSGAKAPKILEITSSNDTPHIIINFFNKHGGMESESDNKSCKFKKRVELPQSWTDIQKCDRSKILYDYICDLKKQLNLKEPEIINLRTVLNLGIMRSCFGQKNIIVKNAVIEKIEGLLFDSEEKEFFIDSSLNKPEKASSSKTDINNYYGNLIDKNMIEPNISKVIEKLFRVRSNHVTETPSTSTCRNFI